MNRIPGIALALFATTAAVFAAFPGISSAQVGYCVIDSDPGHPGGGTACVRSFDQNCWAYYAVWDGNGTGYQGIGCTNPANWA